MENFYGYTIAAIEKATNVMIKKVYLWMCGALAITGLTAYYVATNLTILTWLFSNSWIMIALIVAELGLVIGLSAAINRISSLTATLMFLAYSVVNGMTLCTIFLVYEIGSIASTFFITTGTFGAMALYGSVTKKDLTKVGNLCLMAVIGLIIATLVNIFFKSTMLEMFVKRSRRRRMDIRPKEVALDAEASREASDFSGTEIRDCIDNDRGLPFLLGLMDREDGFFSHALLIQNQLWYHRNELADDLKESISNYVSTLYRRHSEALSPYARTSLRYKIEVPTFDVHGYDCQNELRGYELALDYIDSFVSKVDLSCPLSPERGVDGIPAIHIY